MIKLLVLSNIAMILVFILRFNTLPPQIPLFYSRPTGEEQLADLWMIFILPFLLNFFYFLNQYLENKLFSDNPLIKKIFYYFNIVLMIIISLVFIRIIFLIS
jgi:hypothetical protein